MQLCSDKSIIIFKLQHKKNIFFFYSLTDIAKIILNQLHAKHIPRLSYINTEYHSFCQTQVAQQIKNIYNLTLLNVKQNYIISFVAISFVGCWASFYGSNSSSSFVSF